MKSRVLKIRNAKGSFGVLFSYYILARGDNATQLETARQTLGQNLFNMLYPYWPEAASRWQLSAESVHSDAGTHLCVFADSYRLTHL